MKLMLQSDWRPARTEATIAAVEAPLAATHPFEEFIMLKFNRAVAFVIAAGAVAMGSPAIAGDCPTGQERANPLANAPTMPKGVTDTVIGSIDLGTEIGVRGRLLRTRRLVVEPGGKIGRASCRGRVCQYV